MDDNSNKILSSEEHSKDFDADDDDDETNEQFDFSSSDFDDDDDNDEVDKNVLVININDSMKSSENLSQNNNKNVIQSPPPLNETDFKVTCSTPIISTTNNDSENSLAVNTSLVNNLIVENSVVSIITPDDGTTTAEYSSGGDTSATSNKLDVSTTDSFNSVQVLSGSSIHDGETGAEETGADDYYSDEDEAIVIFLDKANHIVGFLNIYNYLYKHSVIGLSN